MIASTRASRFRRRSLRRFGRDRRAMAAVEFALIAPVMFLLYLGGTDLTQALAIDRKVSLAARVAADLIARQSTQTLTDATLASICQGTVAMIAPHDRTKMTVVVSSIATDTSGVSKVAWSRKFAGGDCTAGASGTSTGSVVSMPAGITVNGSTLIMGETSYDYNTMFDIVVKTGLIHLDQIAYTRPRLFEKICYKSC